MRYLDDLLFVGPRELLVKQVPKVLRLLEDLGFIISPKYVLTAEDTLDFIGYKLDRFALSIKASTINKVITKYSDLLVKCKQFGRPLYI